MEDRKRSGLGWGVIFLWKRSENDDIICVYIMQSCRYNK